MNETEITTKVAILEKDVDNFTQLFSKFDITLEKMSEISNDVSRLLYLHDQRIDSLHESDKILEIKLEQQRSNFTEEIKQLHNHIRENNKDIMEKLKSSEESIKSEIKSVKDGFNESMSETKSSIKETNKRIDAIEKWKWVVIGGSLVVGWLISKLPINFTI